MELSQKIYELRTAQGLSQSDLAERLGVSRQSVSKWETGQAVPDLDKIVKLADLFGVTVDQLVREGEVPQPPQPEPRVIYVEKKREWTAAQKSGAALEGAGLLALLLGALAHRPYLAFFGFLAVLLGLPLLLFKKHPWLWTGWLVVAVSLLFLNPYSSVSPWGLVGGLNYVQLLIHLPELRHRTYYLAAAIGIVRGTLVLALVFFTWRAWKTNTIGSSRGA